MEKFAHYVAIKVNRWGKGLLGDSVQIEEYDHIYFDEPGCVESAYKLLDKLLRAGKREDITISLYESGERVDTVRRLFVRLDAGYRLYGVVDVGLCDDHGCFDCLRQMDRATTKSEMMTVIDSVALQMPKAE